MRHRLALAASALLALTLGACHPGAFPPNVTPPRAATPSRPPAPSAPTRSSFSGPLHLTAAPTRVKLGDLPGRLPGTPEEEGRRYAQAYCSGCHAVGMTGASPNPEAPPFRVVVKRYPPDDLAETFNEGIVVGHPKMPPFVFSPERAGDLIAYLKTLAP